MASVVSSINWRLNKTFSKTSFRLRKWRGVANREKAFHNSQTPILVFSMGKVGTTSIGDALRRALPNSAVYHIHGLTSAWLAREEEIYQRHYARTLKLDDHLLNAFFLRQMIQERGFGPIRWKIVSGIRDPIARNASAFFQTLNLHKYELGFFDRIRKGEVDTVVPEMIDYFCEEYDHSRSLAWFDQEIKGNFGIDVYEEEFSTSDGFHVYNGENVDLLVLRLEDFDRCVEEALCQFAGAKDVVLTKEQDSSVKYYAEAYQRFIKQIVLPESLLDMVYGSQMAQKFYSPSEIDAFRVRWSGGGTQI